MKAILKEAKKIMPSITNNNNSMNSSNNNSRRNTYSAGEGVENIHNANHPSTSTADESNNAATTTKEVRWKKNVPSNHHHQQHDHGNSRPNTSSAASASMTPSSKRAKDRFTNVASGIKNDAVFQYHFEGTPFSHKKQQQQQRRRHHHSHGGHGRHGERIDEGGATAANALDDTFNFGDNTTAEISAINSMFVPGATTAGGTPLDPMNDSLLSMGSKSSMASNASSAASSDASGLDPMNCTTLSDTHELSTSNFIQNSKMRNVLAKRAQALFATNKQNKQGGRKVAVEGETAGESVVERQGNTMAAENQAVIAGASMAVGGRHSTNDESSNSTGTLSSVVGGEATDTLILPDLTLNLDGILSDVKKPAAQPQPPQTQQPREESEDEDEMLEFASHQKSRTPRKSTIGGKNELSLVLNSTSEDTTRSVGGLDSMFADFDDDDSGEVEGTVARKDQVWIDESSKVIHQPDNTEEENRSSRRSRETSFAESTASQNDLNNLLGVEDEETEDVEEMDEDEVQKEEEVKSSQESQKSAGSESTVSLNDLSNLLGMDGEKGDDDVENESGEKTFRDEEEDSEMMKGETLFVESTASQNDLNNLLDNTEGDVEMKSGEKERVVEEAAQSAQATKRMETSFVESTASQNDLNGLLGMDDEEDTEMEESDKKKDNVESPAIAAPAGTSNENPVAESTPLATQPTATSNVATANSSNATPSKVSQSITSLSGMCPSPSFLSGKKQRGSGIPQLRKSLGGDVSKIRKLTASLRKEKKKRVRMSLPGLALAKQQKEQQQKSKARCSMGVLGGNAASMEMGTKEPTNEPPLSLNKAPTQDDKIDSPPPPARKSPSKKKATAAAKSPSRKSPAPTADSPARNTRGAKKSPLPRSPSASNSPARSTRGAMKSPLPRSPAASDSPARNTRGANKSSLPSVDSPARNTRGAKKSPTTTDSPSRNTRSAASSSSPKLHSSARSLFNSPSEIDIFQEFDSNFSRARDGPFSGRKRSNSISAMAAEDEDGLLEPPKKRISTSPDHSEASERTNSSLSKEYPFLSLSPKDNEDEASPPFKTNEDAAPTEGTDTLMYSTTAGTQTLMFGELMQGIENEMNTKKAASPEEEENDMSLQDEEGEDSGEIVFRAKHSSGRKKRRETADTAELMGILSDAAQDDASPKATISAKNKENSSPHTPSGAAANARGRTAKTPKSILSSVKKRGNRPKRNVEFGSPEAAEYNIGSPSVSMTPMHPESVRERYLMPANRTGEEEEHTAELESDLERLIAKGNDTSIMLDPINEHNSKDVSGSSSEGGLSFAMAERTEELETNILNLVDDNRMEESAFSLPSISSVSSGTPSSQQLVGGDLSNSSSLLQDQSKDMSHEDMSMVEPTQTVELEGTIASLLDQGLKNHNHVPPVEETQTMQLEGTLGSLLDDRTTDESAMETEETQTMQLEGTLGSLLDDRKNTSESTLSVEETQTMHLEGTLGSLLDDRENDESAMETEETQTLALEGTLASLLEDRPSKGTDHDITLPSLSSTSSTPPVRNDAHKGNTSCSDESRTMNIEGNMASLLEAVPDDSTGNDLSSAPSQTMELDKNLGALLEGATNDDEQHMPRGEDDTISELGMNTASHSHLLRNNGATSNSSRHIMPRIEDDTVSELGMNTASHTLLRNERILSREVELAQQQLEELVDATPPPEPVDLKLEEVVELNDIDWDQTMESNGDILLETLATVASSANNAASSCPSVKTESQKVLTQICEDIESQLNGIEAESLFQEKIETNEELMRCLQQNLRAEGGSDVKGQARQLLQAGNEAELAEWNKWLTEVAAVYNAELSNTILPMLQHEKNEIAEKSRVIDRNREQVALPMLIRSARRATNRNFERTKGDVASCEDEVSDLEAQVQEAERQLETLQSMQGKIHEVSKSNERSETLRKDEKDQRQTADSSYFKFFSIERLHNWVLMGSNDSSISLAFRGLSTETSIQLLFLISTTSAVTLTAKFDRLPRSANSFMSVTGGAKQTRFHPAVSSFLKSKMDLLCKDMKNNRISSPSDIPTTIHFAELRVARIEEAAKELDKVLGQCKNAFLQPSESLKDGFDFTAYLVSGDSGKGERLNVILSIPDCYPFAPIGVQLHSSGSSFDTASMTRQLKRTIKPGFGALSRAVNEAQNMMLS